MNKFYTFLAFSVLLIWSACTPTPSNVDTNTPEALGISSKAIIAFIDSAEATRPDDLHSFILMRHGKVVAETYWNPFNADSTHMLYSLSKSFTSTAIGLAQAEGLLNVNDQVISFFPEYTPENPSENLQAMRIKDLLRMNTGHRDDATNPMTMDTTSWVKGFLNLEVEFKPGTRFVYNSAATFMLSAIIQKVTGETVFDYLTPRLFEPLGIENAVWDKNPQGINVGGWGLNVRTKDIASLGQLYLQKGEWNGVQILPAAWVAEATSLQTSNGSYPDSDWDQGYGYQFWMCRNGYYRGDGAFGQYCIVMPQYDVVVAITSGTDNMQAIMNLVWDNIVPGIKDAALPEDPGAVAELKEKLSSRKSSVVKPTDIVGMGAQFDGKTFQMQPNMLGITTITCNFKDEISMVFSTNETVVKMPIGNDTQGINVVEFPGMGMQPIASSGTWTSEDTFMFRTYLYKTPYRYEFNMNFKEKELSVRIAGNVSFSGDGAQVLTGKLVE